MTTIAQLGIKVSSEGIEQAEKALNKLSESSLKTEKAIERIIESVKKQNLILQAGKTAFVEYSTNTLNVSKDEK